ncbi:YcxB family protein [Streptomyces griseocarneus]|uniref:YcxB family protein n=1 Tax=Streptomyces griseocarneus TaxID=51201 RepID=UPI00167D82EE|nr:YcxB family protein [Streptomyces griseocarneus]MBZ6472304.1 YcxB family protein [Streptomyces griseocarneus]GHG72723.1 hypothetical protein GCM10018779_48310 [Streptomyces griseocarneus]
MSEAMTAPAPAPAPAPVESLTFEYELTVDDIRSALKARTRVVPAARRTRVLVVLLAVGAAVLQAFASQGGLTAPRAWVPVLVVGLWIVVVLAYAPTRQARAFHRTARLQGRMRTTVGAGGLASASAQSSQSMGWSLFGRYAETKDVFALLSADRRAGCLVILPKRALTAPGDLDRLRALLEAGVPRA